MRKGFSLIELLVVISIIGVIIAIGTVSYLTAQKQTRDTRRKTDLMEIRQALETYRSENGTYFRGTTNQYYVQNNAKFITAITPKYMSGIPNDPKSSSGYRYRYVVPGVNPISYSLYATLENTNDPGINLSLTELCGSASIVCNYTVTNP